MDIDGIDVSFVAVEFESWFECGREVVCGFLVFPDSDRAVHACRCDLVRSHELRSLDAGSMSSIARR